MMLILLALALVLMPFLFADDFARVALVSTYAALAYLMIFGVILWLVWFGLRYDAICRVWRRKMR